MTRPKITPIGFRILWVLATVACFSVLAVAGPLPDGEIAEATKPETTSADVDSSGMRIEVDPETEKIVSDQAPENPVLSAALERALSRSTDGLKIFDLPSGGFGVHLQGRFQNVVTVKVHGDGSFELECVDSTRRAREILHPKTGKSEDYSRVK